MHDEQERGNPADRPLSYESPATAQARPPLPAASGGAAPAANHTGTLPWMVLLLIVLITLLVLPYLAEKIQYSLTRGEQLAKRDVALMTLAGMPETNSRFSVVANAVAPSVVGINTVVGGSFRDEWSGLSPRARGEGSGVIVDPDGYIITNFHVVNQATGVTVQLADGREIKDVRVVGKDPYTDLAVLKIEASDLVAAKWGDSGEIQVGDEVLAIGNPYGLVRTVTSGIVSATQRLAPGVRQTQEFLQTDAAINPGNSGGPLVNLRGEVVGINTAIYGQAYQGISFAIPSQVASQIYRQLKETGQIVRGWLGVQMVDVTAQIADRVGLDRPRGVFVMEAVPDSPAAEAGIRRGDVILRWNGAEITSFLDLSRQVAGTEIGKRVPVLIFRNGREIEVEVEVAERPPEFE